MTRHAVTEEGGVRYYWMACVCMCEVLMMWVDVATFEFGSTVHACVSTSWHSNGKFTHNSNLDNKTDKEKRGIQKYYSQLDTANGVMV